MKNQKTYNSYPLRTVIFANILTLAVYSTGAHTMFTPDLIAGISYVVYLVLLERHFFKEGCIHCGYYGKSCAFGKGIIAALFFKRGDPKKFCERELGFKNFIPQALVTLVPLIVGVA